MTFYQNSQNDREYIHAQHKIYFKEYNSIGTIQMIVWVIKAVNLAYVEVTIICYSLDYLSVH